MKLQTGARTVLKRWLQLKPGEHLLILACSRHAWEADLLRQEAEKLGAFVVLMVVPVECPQVGDLFDTMIEFFLSNDVIVGATNYSLITTNAVKQVIRHGKRYLSLPLSSSNGRSPLSFDFMACPPHEAASMAARILPVLNQTDVIRITTYRGTDLTIGKKGRTAALFNGMAATPGQLGSSSFEVYIAIEEDQTNGHAVLDGSMGYVGVPSETVDLTFRNGRLVEIEHNDMGLFLQDYMDRFQDENIFVAGELGIGLNRRAKCVGNCYIEDESAYETFHIGMGRNLALGGSHNAKGHFDLVFHSPNIYAGDTLIMKDGKIVV